MIFALLKLEHLLLRINPHIVQKVKENVFDNTDKFNLAENDFMMAVTVERYDGSSAMDPRYIQPIATLVRSMPDSYEEFITPMKPCTDTQLAKLYPAESAIVEARLQSLKAAKLLYCYEFEDGLDLYGSYRDGNMYQSLDIGVYPCASRYTASDGTVHGGGDDCVWDFNDYSEYLSSGFSLLALYNKKPFRKISMMSNAYRKPRLSKNSQRL